MRVFEKAPTPVTSKTSETPSSLGRNFLDMPSSLPSKTYKTSVLMFRRFWRCVVSAHSQKTACALRGFVYTRNVSETTDAGFDSLNNRSAHAALSGFFVRIAFVHLFYGWASAGASSDAPVPSVAGLSTPPCARPPHLTVDGGPSNKPKEPAMRANVPARSELCKSQVIATAASTLTLEIINRALSDAALADNVHDALDYCGNALLALAQMIRAEVRHG
jgi:hypothetical protein